MLTFSIWTLCEGVADLTLEIIWSFFLFLEQRFSLSQPLKVNGDLTYIIEINLYFFMVAYGKF